jgi:protein-glutamine gamma-glutamyltransferase
MIVIEGRETTTFPQMEGYTPNALQHGIFEMMSVSRDVFRYSEAFQLIAELRIRNSIVAASRGLAYSGIEFKTFRESMANPEFWQRNMIGGFVLKSEVRPSDAIEDIYRHGALYGTECSTAMVIVLYKAMLDVLPRETFDRLYPDIYLMNWDHIDRDLHLTKRVKAADELPGDARYFINPDVDPLHPEWRGENVYVLGGGLYYGHGIGIADAGKIIRSLNAVRKKDAERSAYLIDSTKRQNYIALSKYLTASETSE